MNKNIFGHSTFLIIFLILLNLFLISTNFLSFSNAQINGDPFSFSSDFSFIEYCQIEGGEENVSSIHIDLPEPNWTISNIQINFTDLSLGSQIRVIEETETGLEQIWNKNVNFRTFALGTQIEILEVTDLLGVYIKGYKTIQANETIQFQVQGFNEATFSPNGIIYRSIDLNISTSLDWYYQDFSSNPISLPIGNYSLVMNGTSLPISTEAKYFWQKDDLDPEIPFLYTSSYITSWTTGTVNTSFLSKLKVSDPSQLYFPSELNMTAQINGDNYEVTNGLTIGKGFLDISNLTQFMDEPELNIPILINQSLILNYHYDYSIYLNNEFSTLGSTIVEEFGNRWSMSPIINRVSNNYEIQFDFPGNWYNLTVFRKSGPLWENVTSNAIINLTTSTLIIPNNTILGGYEWKITANSPNIIFDINLPELRWRAGQELQFSVILPFSDGNLTFFLINPLGFGYNEPIELKEVLSTETLFSYLIPSSSREGYYNILIYWNNMTDAGVHFQQFEIYIIPPPPITEIVIGVILAIVGFTGGLIGYQQIKKYRIKKIEESEKLFNKCMDVLNLHHVIVSDKKSGLNIYQQPFTEREIDAAMISGFLQAIHSFGIELIKIEDSSQTIKLEYKDSIIIMTEFVNIRLILIMKAHPSSNFLYSLEDLAYDLYKYFGELIDKFSGDIQPFKAIEKLLKHHLNTSLTYPMKISEQVNLDSIRIHPSGKAMISKAKSIMKRQNSNTFYLSSLLPEKECSPKDLETVLALLDKKIFLIIE
ncbi:MAG: hypothetical protein ACFE9S_04680 [Candidatus Hermodarchaeota archaeon]